MTEEEARDYRILAYRVKAERAFACEECGATRRVLAVRIGEDLGTRCVDRCLDRRSHKPIPGQWEEREIEEAAMKAARR